MQIPTVTKSQRRILFYLSSFRFLYITHLQKLFSHKDPHRIKEWLTDLKEKKLISVIKDPKNITKPHIICLDQKARYILKEDPDIDKNFLNRLYKEKNAGEDFISRLLVITDTYLYFLKNKDKKTQIDFFTQQDLQGYNYYPDPLPDAYIDEHDGKEHNRYFLYYFDTSMSAKELRYHVSTYFKYAEGGSWQDNTDNAPFPAILLIFENERKKKHIYYYAKSLLEKSFTDEIEIFLTTKEKILKDQEDTNIWERVEIEA